MFEEITSVDELEIEEVYDLEIDSEFHNFYANDILVHNCTYAYIAWQTLFFKVYYPAYFYSAMINIAPNIDEIQGIIADARANELVIHPQSVKHSEYLTRAEDINTIRLGFGMIKGMGQSTIEDCNSFRKFDSLTDLLKAKFKGINKTQYQNLIDLGAFDDYGIDRVRVMQLKDLYQDDKIQDWFTRKRQPLRLETIPKTLEAMFDPTVCLQVAMKAKKEVEEAMWDDNPLDIQPWDLMVDKLLSTLKVGELNKAKYAKDTGKKQVELMGFSLIESPLIALEKSLKLKGYYSLKEFSDPGKKYYFNVEKIEKALTKTGKEYLKLFLNDGIKAKCWRAIDLQENEVYYGKFTKDNFGFTLNDREVYKAL